MARTQKINFFKLHYDKLIVAVVLLSLLASLGLLMMRQGERHTNESNFNAKLRNLKAKYPTAEAPSSEAFEQIMDDLESPLVVGTNSLFVAAERVACIKCGLPIPMDMDKCKYCDAEQPTGAVDVSWDSDKDGLPDEWENLYGLNPLDASDAHGDLDGDNFTNLEEKIAGTDPSLASSRPPLIQFLRAEKIDAIPFGYVLKSKSRLGGVNAYSFMLNDTRGQSYMLKIGQELNGTGWKADSVTIKKVSVQQAWGKSEKEIAVLKLVNGEDFLELTENGGPVLNSFVVTLTCDKDRAMAPIEIKQRGQFNFDGKTYVVVRVERAQGTDTVIIREVSSKTEIKIPKAY